jgi:hypothetical protein
MINSPLLLSLWMLLFFLSGALLGWGIRGIIEFKRHKEFVKRLKEEQEELETKDYWIH